LNYDAYLAFSLCDLEKLLYKIWTYESTQETTSKRIEL
jgi:hypothetical protein